IKSLVILWVLGSIIEVNPKYYPVPKRAWFLIAGALHAFDGILRVKGYLISNGSEIIPLETYVGKIGKRKTKKWH
ncbi:MAG: hypothetical protein WAP14_05320, partial [Acetomicrobium sp.]